MFAHFCVGLASFGSSPDAAAMDVGQVLRFLKDKEHTSLELAELEVGVLGSGLAATDKDTQGFGVERRQGRGPGGLGGEGLGVGLDGGGGGLGPGAEGAGGEATGKAWPREPRGGGFSGLI